MTKIRCFYLLFVFAVVAFLPQTASAATVVMDNEVSQCIDACMARKPGSSADLDKCRAELETCKGLNDAWVVAYAKLADICGFKALTTPGDPVPKKTSTKTVVPPKPPAQPVIVCEGLATRSGDDCVCPKGIVVKTYRHKDGWTVRQCVYTVEEVDALIEEQRANLRRICRVGSSALGRSPELNQSCEEQGEELEEMIIWFRGLKNGKYPLDGKSWTFIFNKVLNFDGRLAKIEEELGKLKDQVRDHEDRIRKLERKPFGPFKGGIAWALTGCGFYLHRPGAYTDTYGFCGGVGLTGWVDDTHGMRVRGIAGMGFNPDSRRLYTGADVAYRVAFDKKKATSLALGLEGSVEPNDRGNEFANLGGLAELNLRPGGGAFLLAPSLTVGATKGMVYEDGTRTGPNAWSVFLKPAIHLGVEF